MRSKFSFATLAVFGAFTGMVSISPQDALSNLRAWLEFFGLGGFSHLISEQTSGIIFGVCISILVVMAARLLVRIYKGIKLLKIRRCRTEACFERPDGTAYRIGFYRTGRKERHMGVYFERPNGKHLALSIKYPFIRKSVVARPKGPLIVKVSMGPATAIHPSPEPAPKAPCYKRLWHEISKYINPVQYLSAIHERHGA